MWGEICTSWKRQETHEATGITDAFDLWRLTSDYEHALLKFLFEKKLTL
jgi:hypothetical protein